MTGRVPKTVDCSCGYRGPAVEMSGQSVCPICRSPATGPAPAVNPAAPQALPPSSGQTKRYRIPCPQGHVLKAAPHMFGQKVVCPECNEMFVLRLEDSLEQRKEKDKERLVQEELLARRWLTWSIWAAVFVVFSLLGLIAFSLVRPGRAPPPDDPPTVQDPAAQSE